MRTQNTQNAQMNADYLFKEKTDKIISAFYEVYHILGTGFLERVYQNALYYELLDRGFKCVAQQKMQVYYKDRIVGDYIADMLVDDCIILELKAIDELNVGNEYQLLNYLRATGLQVGLLLNFGRRPQVKRMVNTKRLILRSSAYSVSSAFSEEDIEEGL